MKFTMPMIRHRVACLAGTGALMLAGTGGLAVSWAGQANAQTVCTPGTPCTITGTATLGTGTLGLTTPASLSWSTTLTGVAQQLVDSSTSDTQLTVNDATGSASGWNVTVSATTFTSPVSTLSDTGTLVATGSTSSESSTTAPSGTCTNAGDCTPPAGNTVTYPLAITTAPTSPAPVTLYSAATGSGIGSVLIGDNGTGLNPLGWWINVPGSTVAGTYTSTFTFNIASGP
jgi:hypothetical protein